MGKGSGKKFNNKRPPRDLIEQVRAFSGYALIVDAKKLRLECRSASTEQLPLTRNGILRSRELISLVKEVKRTKESVTRPFEVELGPLKYIVAQGYLVRDRWVFIVIQDNTAAIRADEIRKAFVANISHELRTPVTAVALLGEAIISASDDPEAVRHFAGRLAGVASRLEQLVDDMTTLSEIDERGNTKTETVDLHEIVEKAAGNVAELAEKNRINLQYLKRNHALIAGNVRELITAVENLLTNAIHYSPRGSRVVVTTRLDQTEGEATISVIDQGIGIDAEEQERVFERFYRTDEARSRRTGGTGLGLAIVKNIAIAHGGRATVYSLPGKGSTFAITLPLLPEEEK